MTPSKISCVWNQPEIAGKYRAAVSLHSHTNFSKESLHFIPAFAEKWPILRRALDKQCQKSCRPVDFSTAYWRPPVSAKVGFELESKQIEHQLDLMSLVSLTDHDSMGAPMSLRQLSDSIQIPLSVEWSVPFEDAVFHLGVHNLPENLAAGIMEDLAEYTRDPCKDRLVELMAALHELPEVLIVFNHPLWDQLGPGELPFQLALERFLQGHVEFLHAFELNAMRKWGENKRVVQLSELWRRPVVSGGDRHGCEPSGAVNLTRAANFSLFVQEIREKQLSHVLFMPQYAEPRSLRFWQTVIDVLREYPEYPLGSRRWDERVFHIDCYTGCDSPLSALWKAPPPFLGRIFSVIRVAEKKSVRQALNYTFGGNMELPLVSEIPCDANA
ncbi:MAG TPA: hypothetical protein VN974_11935 [Candidatus Dormibacteraeota bacterium]|nr:hypothetical protein [Candidatus Dormibacteraeota bacterium]